MKQETKQEMKKQIEELFNSPTEVLKNQANLIEKVISELDQGKLKVCEQRDDKQWQVHEWIKKAILIYFRYKNMTVIKQEAFSYFDKIPVKQWGEDSRVRVVPQAIARYGSFIDEGAILMPSYINIGAFVGKKSLIDTWATVGSCAFVGDRVHLSGGVGVGGVLEPLQAHPVIIEESCFIGSRSILVEGVHIEKASVIGAGVTITGSTKILDLSGPRPREYRGFIPSGSVVIPGTREKSFPAGKYQIPCAIIIGQRKTSTDEKTSLNEALREYGVPV